MKEEQIAEPRLHRINLTILISITTLSVIGLLSFFLIDERVSHWFSNHQNTWLDWDYWKIIKGFGRAWLPVWLLLNWICATGRQRPALVGLLALILVCPMVTSLKVLVHRPRPKEVLMASMQTGGAEENNKNWWSHHLSFPSGDVAVAFATATSLALFVSRPWMLLFFAVAGFVSVLRVAVLAHHTSDVCGGAIVGIFSAWLALQIILRWLPKFKFRRGHAAAGAIIVPIVFGVMEGTGDLLVWLKMYGVLVVIIYLIANAGTLSKRLRKRVDNGRQKTDGGEKNL
jgi:undecaprenyl-diphosphatase